MSADERLLGSLNGEFVDGPFGSNLKADEYVEAGVPILRLQNIRPNLFRDKDIKFIPSAKAERLKRHSYGPGDVVIAKLGDVGTACVIPDSCVPGVVVADVIRFRSDESEIDHQYLTYFLNSAEGQRRVISLSKGTTRTRTNLTDLKKISIPLPPLPEQRRIAAILDKADALRTKRREAIAKLDQLLQSVFLDMFGDPVANRKCFHAGSMGDYIAVGPSNGLSKTKDFLGRGVPLLDNKAVYRGMYVDFSDQRLIDVSDGEKQRFQVQQGDIMFNRVSVKPEGVGVAALALKPPENCVFESNLIRVRLTPELDPVFTIAMLRTESCRRHVLENANVANQASISQGVIRSIPVVVPPPDKQKKFSAFVKYLDNQREKLSVGQLSASSLFRALLTNGFSGGL